MNFKEFKLSTKLILSFSLVVSILLIVNIYANLRLLYLQKSNNEIVDTHLPGLIALAETKLLLSDFRAAQLDHATISDTLGMKFEEKMMMDFVHDIHDRQQKYKVFLEQEHSNKTNTLKKLYANYEESWEDYLVKHQKFLVLSRNNKNIEALKFLENEAKFIFDYTADRLKKTLDTNKKIFTQQVNGVSEVYKHNVIVNLLLLLIPLFITIFIIRYLVKIILKPIRELENAVRNVSQGNLDVEIKISDTDDEIGRLTQDFKTMTENIKLVKKNLDTREWVRNGRTELNQIINESIDAQINIIDFSQEIISFMAHYTGAKLGAIYLIEADETTLELTAGFALLNPVKTIQIGEGLLGQFVKEIIQRTKQKKQIHFINNMPEGFLKITSATGEAFAQNLIFVPFEFENELIGVVELAGWANDDTIAGKTELVTLLASNIGIGFHSQLNALKIRKLLHATQIQAQQLEEQATVLEEKNQDISQQNEEIQAQRDALDAERKKADELLLNILPVEIAQQLKEKGYAKPQYYKRATVLFTDFKGFTRFASSLSPEEIISELDYCFCAFDEITAKYGLEKIKTIGDSYMCAGGLPTPNETNPTDTVSAALEIITFMEKWHAKRLAEGKSAWQIRIGIHTGELIAGVVGKRKFAYDIWGDAVNVASRMESNSEADKINISATTYELVKDKFICTYRGKLPVKNVGDVSMYFVEGFKK